MNTEKSSTLCRAKRQPLRILSVLPNLNGGGAQRIALDLAKEFDAAGDVSMVCSAGSSGVLRSEVGDLAFFGFDKRLTLASLVPFVRFLMRAARQSKAQVILVHLLPLNLLVLALALIRIITIPVVVVEHNNLSAAEDSVDATWIRRRLTKLLVGALYPTASAVVGVSQPVAKDIARRMRQSANVRAIPNGIDVDRIAERCTTSTLESEMLESLPSPRLVAIGRLEHQKGFDVLLEAFAELRSRPAFESANLVIIGEGGERRRLERHAQILGVENAVWMPGFIANPWAAMARADVFILSSRHEGFGLVVAEAVACGLPVVSTDCRSGPSEILADNPRSRLVPVEDAAAMADAIAEILKVAKEIPPVPLPKEYTLDETARRYRELFREVVA